MRHQKFVVTTTVLMFCFVAVVAGLAFYSTFNAAASAPSIPDVVHYLPAASQGVFGMNVQKFLDSPIYQKMQAKQGAAVGQDLQEFINNTGVDPRSSIRYVVAAVGRESLKEKGIVIIVAKNQFNPDQITSFIYKKSTKVAPIELTHQGAKVLMFPEDNGNKIEKGIAFMGSSAIAMGDLDSIKGVLDVRATGQGGLDSTPLGQLVNTVTLNTDDMFWFAGDASSVIAQAPTTTPMLSNFSEIQSIYGTLNLTDAVDGKITATTRTGETAEKLVQVIQGFKALGSMALNNTTQAPELTDLVNQLVNAVQVKVIEGTKVQLSVNFPIDLLDKLETMKSTMMRPKKTTS